MRRMIEELRKISKLAEEKKKEKNKVNELKENEKEKKVLEKYQLKRKISEQKVDKKVAKLIRAFEKKAQKAAAKGEYELDLWEYKKEDFHDWTCKEKPYLCTCVFKEMVVCKLKEYFQSKGAHVKHECYMREKLPLETGYEGYRVSVSWKE